MSINTTSIYRQDNLNSSNFNYEQIYKFEEFRLDAANLILFRENQPLALAPKVVETLLILIERTGEIVGKEDLINRLWADTIVEDANLTQNIYLLRKTLGTQRDGKPFIETFRRRGYRFNGTVEKYEKSEQINSSLERKADGESDLPELIRAGADEKSRQPETIAVKMPAAASPANGYDGDNRYFVFGVIAACGLMILLGFGWSRLGKTHPEAASTAAAPQSQNIQFKRLTPDLYAYNPAISPDGRLLAYSLVENGKQSIWLKDLRIGSTAQLTPPIAEGGYKALLFSPDGNALFYMTSRQNVPNGIVFRVPVSSDGTAAAREVARNIISPSAVSPDGSRIAYVGGSGKLMIANADGSGGERVLDERRTGCWVNSWDAQISWSPDGEWIAATGGYLDETGKRRAELFEVSVSGDEYRIPTPDWFYVGGAVWLADRSGLLVLVQEREHAPSQIWRVSYPSGEVSRVTNDLNDYNWISLSADSRLLVAQQSMGQSNIWTAPFVDTQKAQQLTFGNAAEDGNSGIAFMSDGRIVYTSMRTGNADLWMMNADGSNQKQLTQNAGGSNIRPRVTPDDRYVVFSSNRTGENLIWRMDADGGNPKLLSGKEKEALGPALSPDGKWVYYGYANAIWKVSIDGGESVRVSEDLDGFNYVAPSAASPDGKLIAYGFYNEGTPNPWRIGIMDAGDGEPLRSFDLFYPGIVRWTASSKSFVYIKSGNLWEQPLDGESPRRLTNFSQAIGNFAVSPDYKQIAFSRGNKSTEAVLISNFR